MIRVQRLFESPFANNDDLPHAGSIADTPARLLAVSCDLIGSG